MCPKKLRGEYVSGNGDFGFYIAKVSAEKGVFFFMKI
jgi:hypothetical protein